MRDLRGFLTTMALSLVLVSAARAGDDKKPSDKKGEEQTIKGVISEVTLVGETDVDYATDKAVVSESIYLTIIGHPSNSEATEKGSEHATKNNDAKSTSKDGSNSAEKPKHRMNVYVIAVSPKTKFCECKETGKEGANAAKEEKCNLDRLEIGDRVEISFAAMSPEKDAAQSVHQKHGRHRTFFGVADDVKILPELKEASAAESKEKK